MSADGWQFIWHAWQHVGPFKSAAALQAIARDREALIRFEREDARGAGSIRDYLDLWRADLDTLEAIARDLGNWRGEYWRRPSPSNRMTTGRKYGGDAGGQDDAA